MSLSLLCILVLSVVVSGQELLITRAFTDYLKRHATWEVVDYEANVFKGWTDDEMKSTLGLLKSEPVPLQSDLDLATTSELPPSIDWRTQADCVHVIRSQGGCGSCWAFAVAGMISDRCCLSQQDHGWLSVQELV